MTVPKKLTGKEIPLPLREIADPPKELYLEGNLPNWQENIFLTVVGSRKYTSYGRNACEQLIKELRGYPIVIVSGLALGIDAIAHRAALDAGLTTIAVPGSGLDRSALYPRQNLRLAEEILEKGGALLSELPPDTHATAYSFPQRNRIMAGMSHAILVIEAGEKSGTLITARMAAEYNKNLLVVPGSIFSPTSLGANHLIRQGGHPVCSGQEILEVLGIKTDTEPTTGNLKLTDLAPKERKIIDLLLIEALPKDLLVAECGWPASELNSLLSIMEIKGLIKEQMGVFEVCRF